MTDQAHTDEAPDGAGFDPSRDCERLAEALEAVPIPGRLEPMEDFRRRSDAWLADHYRKAASLLDRINAARRVIEQGYPRLMEKVGGQEKCPHGRFYHEDCIGCYDEALIAALDGPLYLQTGASE